MTTREIAAAAGIGKRYAEKRAAREGWPYREVRGRGGRRRLYPVESLPEDIQAALNAPSTVVKGADKMAEKLPMNALARWERLPEVRRQRALDKLVLVDRSVAIAAEEGLPMREACDRAAAESGSRWSGKTLLVAWLTVRGLPRENRAVALADNRDGRTATTPMSEEAWEAFKADYLRAERPYLAQSCRLVRRLTEAHGGTVPRSDRPFLRRLEREVPPEAVTLARYGTEAVARRYPAQVRDREALASMEALCADGHTWDVRVHWPDGRTGRPVMVAWQDIRSGRILGWRLGCSETTSAYRLSLADVLWRHGAPEHVIVDNGRGIAAKALTGGKQNRYRGKVLPDDPLGLLTELVGADGIHWAMPYSGQSKPIERAFRDFCGAIAKDPRLAGAYTGPGPERKPHNYGQAAIPLERFRAVVADGVAEHNARRGRRGLGMDGRSFDEVFEAALAGRAPHRLSTERLARWLLASDVLTARKTDGSVELHGTRYWSEELGRALAGQPQARRRVVVRYDPDDLSRPTVIERLDGSLLARAEAQGRTAYFDAAAAEAHNRARRRLQKLGREQLEIHRGMDAAEIGLLLDEAAVSEPEAPVLEGVIPIAPAPRAEPAEPAPLIDFEAWTQAPGDEEEDLARMMRESEETIRAMALGGYE